ncbi:hypothetical protein BP00DRAFT_426711, partial [Aspergillus indologenus CBS 114.80]
MERGARQEAWKLELRRAVSSSHIFWRVAVWFLSAGVGCWFIACALALPTHMELFRPGFIEGVIALSAWGYCRVPFRLQLDSGSVAAVSAV